MNAANVKKVDFRPETPFERMPLWECVLCRGDSFKLHGNGDIFCACCRARVSSIKVVKK